MCALRRQLPCGHYSEDGAGYCTICDAIALLKLSHAKPKSEPTATPEIAEQSISANRRKFGCVWGLFIILAVFASCWMAWKWIINVEEERTSEERRQKEELAWIRARDTRDPHAVLLFVKEFDKGLHASEAKQLYENLAWTDINKTHSLSECREYVDFLWTKGIHSCQITLILAQQLHSYGMYYAAGESCAMSSAEHDSALNGLAALNKSDDDVYKRVYATRDPKKIREYLEEFPEGKHKEEAKALEDDVAYSLALKRGPDEINRYLSAHPDGRHKAEATAVLQREDQITILLALSKLKQAQVPRLGVELFVLDEGEHGKAVTEIASAVFRGRVRYIDMSGSTVPSRLMEVVFEKLRNPTTDIVVNMSWTLSRADEIEAKMFQALSKSGVVFVAAAGNDGGGLAYPASDPSVLAVGSVEPEALELTSYSNRGPALAFCSRDYTSKRTSEFLDKWRSELQADYCQSEIRDASFSMTPVETRQRVDLPPISQPLIAGVSRFLFSSEIISQPPSRLCKCGKRSLLSTFT